jgi:hypothetical protein
VRVGGVEKGNPRACGKHYLQSAGLRRPFILSFIPSPTIFQPGSISFPRSSCHPRPSRLLVVLSPDKVWRRSSQATSYHRRSARLSLTHLSPVLPSADKTFICRSSAASAKPEFKPRVKDKSKFKKKGAGAGEGAYRDRAAERRTGGKSDFAEAEKLLEVSFDDARS